MPTPHVSQTRPSKPPAAACAEKTLGPLALIYIIFGARFDESSLKIRSLGSLVERVRWGQP